MNEVADPLPRRARNAYVRWSLLTVPTVLLAGIASGKLSDSGYGNRWFDLLAKPAIMPPSWVFPFAWTILYIVTALALAFILNAPKGKARSVAITLFLVQLGLNLAWSPVFFGMHRIMLAFGILLAIIFWAGATTLIFWRIRRAAGLLMLPYLAWLLFAAVLNWQVHELNPHGLTLVPDSGGTQIIVQ